MSRSVGDDSDSDARLDPHGHSLVYTVPPCHGFTVTRILHTAALSTMTGVVHRDRHVRLHGEAGLLYTAASRGADAHRAGPGPVRLDSEHGGPAVPGRAGQESLSRSACPPWLCRAGPGP